MKSYAYLCDCDSNVLKYSRRHRRYSWFIVYWTIGVKIPVPARVFMRPRCRSVKIDRGYMQDLSSAFARSCTYGQEFPVEMQVRNQFGIAKVCQAAIRWRARLVYVALSVARDSFLRVRASRRSFRSLPSVPSTPATDIDPPTWRCRFGYYFVSRVEGRGAHVASET